MPTRTPKRALAAVFAAVALVTSVFAVPGVCAEPPADVVVGFVDRPEPGYYSRTIMPTLAAMARAMPDRTVTGVRLSPDDPIADLMRLRPDILVAPASVYMELELNYGGHAIATRKTRWADNPSASVGAAVVVRADNNEIRTLADLRGRRMASGGADAVDGWLALAYELKERRLRPESYRAHTAFLNFPMPDVISAVLSGKVEAGVLSTCMLERAELAGLLKPGALRVVDEKTTQGFSCRHSTALYPDIVVAALPRTAPDVVKATTLALLSMPENADFAWQVATNFVSVNRLYKELHLGPWKHLDDWSWRNLWKSYGTYALIILGFLAWLVLDEIRLKQTVRRRTAALTQALAERIRGNDLEIELLVINLMKNADQAACDDTGEDVQSRPEVTVSLRLEPDDAGGPDMAEIVVEDNGPAISDEAFGRMKRVSDSVKEDGLGLGLAIVRNIVDEHGGRLTIVRLSPCGLRVTAALPMYSPALTQQDEQS